MKKLFYPRSDYFNFITMYVTFILKKSSFLIRMRIVALLKIFMNGAIQVAIRVVILRVISKDDPGAILRAIQRALKGDPASHTEDNLHSRDDP